MISKTKSYDYKHKIVGLVIFLKIQTITIFELSPSIQTKIGIASAKREIPSFRPEPFVNLDPRSGSEKNRSTLVDPREYLTLEDFSRVCFGDPLFSDPLHGSSSFGFLIRIYEVIVIFFFCKWSPQIALPNGVLGP